MTAFDESLAQTQPHLPVSRGIVIPASSPSDNAAVGNAQPALPGAALPPRKHSGFGIVSFVWALVVGVGEFMIIGLTGILSAVNPDFAGEPSLLLGILGLLICAAFPACFFGVALGVVGLFQRDRHKVFPILGLVFNAVIAFSVGLLIVIGNQMNSDLLQGASSAWLGALGFRV
jgi:hypothetical protein